MNFTLSERTIKKLGHLRSQMGAPSDEALVEYLATIALAQTGEETFRSTSIKHYLMWILDGTDEIYNVQYVFLPKVTLDALGSAINKICDSYDEYAMLVAHTIYARIEKSLLEPWEFSYRVYDHNINGANHWTEADFPQTFVELYREEMSRES